MSLNETPLTPQAQVGQFGANIPRTLFRELICHFQIDPLNHQVDVAAANLAAFLASSRGVCVGIVPCTELRHYHGVLAVLRPYGVIGRTKLRTDNRTYLVFLEHDPKHLRVDYLLEWFGATVTARTRRVTAVAA